MYDSIISVENLLGAWGEFRRGKKHRNDVQFFEMQLMDTILQLHEALHQQTYKHGGYEHFVVTDPKRRDIHKASVRDRLLHHALYRVLYPVFDKTFIAHSYSCRNGKGTQRAIHAFAAMTRKESQNHTKTVWILKCDVRKFFASIDHRILKRILAKQINDGRILRLLSQVIDSFETVSDTGLPLGNLTSQLLVNIYMNEFDQWVKRELKVAYYIRYADDFLVLGRNKAYLLKTCADMRVFLGKELRLELHPDKVSISTIASGVDFLGWVHFPHHRVLRTVTKRRIGRRLSKNQVSPATKQAYSGLLSHGNAYKLGKILQSR